jgi:hypothetical protein
VPPRGGAPVRRQHPGAVPPHGAQGTEGAETSPGRPGATRSGRSDAGRPLLCPSEGPRLRRPTGPPSSPVDGRRAARIGGPTGGPRASASRARWHPAGRPRPSGGRLRGAPPPDRETTSPSPHRRAERTDAHDPPAVLSYRSHRTSAVASRLPGRPSPASRPDPARVDRRRSSPPPTDGHRPAPGRCPLRRGPRYVDARRCAARARAASPSDSRAHPSSGAVGRRFPRPPCASAFASHRGVRCRRPGRRTRRRGWQRSTARPCVEAEGPPCRPRATCAPRKLGHCDPAWGGQACAARHDPPRRLRPFGAPRGPPSGSRAPNARARVAAAGRACGPSPECTGRPHRPCQSSAARHGPRRAASRVLRCGARGPLTGTGSRDS